MWPKLAINFTNLKSHLQIVSLSLPTSHTHTHTHTHAHTHAHTHTHTRTHTHTPVTTFCFSGTTFEAVEGDGAARVRIQRTGSPKEAACITMETADGTAVG